MIEINLKWQLASSKKDTSKLKLKIEKKSIGLDTSTVVPYLLIKKCDWQNNNIRNIKSLYSEQIKAFDNIKNDIDTYLSYTNDLNKDDILNYIKNIILKNDYRQKTNSYDNMLLSKYLTDELDKKEKERAKSTVDNYKTNIGKIKEYEDYYLRTNKKPLLIKNYNESFLQNFINYQANQENYYKAYPMVKSLKGLFRLVFTNDERMINIITKPFIPIADPNENNNINDDLPFELEIFEKMFNLKNLTEKEEIARQWLVIACYTGLRVDDLLNKLNENQIDVKNNVIEIVPEKTKKHKDNVVNIPIWGHLSDYFKKNNYKLPKRISKNEYSKSIKLLYKKVDSTTTVNREKRVKTTLQNGKEATRKVFNTYYVYDCFSPHDSRRFFVTTMVYIKKLLTPEEAMIITGHKDLKTLRIYDKSDKRNIIIKKAKELQGQYITSI